VNDTEGFSDSVFRTFSTACDIRVESSYNGANDEAVRNLEAVGEEYRPVAPQERQDLGVQRLDKGLHRANGRRPDRVRT
jgi:hypothetical protein